MVGGNVAARKVMVVADPSRESAVSGRSSGIGSYASSFAAAECGGGGEVDFLDGMKRTCMARQPKVKVVAEKVEMTDGKDKASAILAHSAASKVDLLIIGQRKTLSNALLGPRKVLSLKGFDTADYVVENSKCTCVAVQKKGQKAGYLLNSKTHKNFWLLA
ncbi:hypothetical protein Salat_2113500 [Sesamum alatum]|uniref:UspA domain-containing protein n=1 Tax=Sesamum alatum TaxID=300844 RepID=A0AAE1Y0Y8_9LAMI|nr:hypothetical protein Salat_2113500 [Sesamum alatum]